MNIFRKITQKTRKCGNNHTETDSFCLNRKTVCLKKMFSQVAMNECSQKSRFSRSILLQITTVKLKWIIFACCCLFILKRRIAPEKKEFKYLIWFIWDIKHIENKHEKNFKKKLNFFSKKRNSFVVLDKRVCLWYIRRLCTRYLNFPFFSLCFSILFDDQWQWWE